MEELIDSYINTKGELYERTNLLNNQVTKMTKVQDQIDIRKTHVESRYLKQFSSLDLFLTKMQSISASLTQLMQTLPSLKVSTTR